MILPNLLTALTTPFKNGLIDYDCFHKQVNRQVNAHIEGLVLLGTTAETPTLSPIEKKQLLIEGVKAAPNSHLMVGTGTNNTQETIQHTKQAEALGASSALVITPYYNNPSMRGVFEHFKQVAQNTSLPVILYNHPGRASQNISIETLEKLVEIPNIVGIKDASASFNYLQDLTFKLPSLRPDFQVFSGDDLNFLPIASLGSKGLISVASNLIPKQMSKLANALTYQDYLKARQIHQELFPLFKALCLEPNPIPIKKALELVSLDSGELRLPLIEMNDINTSKLNQILNNMVCIDGTTQRQHHEVAN